MRTVKSAPRRPARCVGSSRRNGNRAFPRDHKPAIVPRNNPVRPGPGQNKTVRPICSRQNSTARCCRTQSPRPMYCTDRPPKPLDLRRRQPSRRPSRRNARAKQRFARIDVADAGHQRLVQQLDLDGLPRAFQRPSEMPFGQSCRPAAPAPAFSPRKGPASTGQNNACPRK